VRRAWPFGLTIGLLVAGLYLSGFLETPEALTIDLRFDLRGPRAPTFPIVLVTADDDSFAEMERQWPWPRGFHAQLLDRIAAGGPLAIGVDIVFAEPSRPREDRRLGEAVRRAKRVVLGATLRSMATSTEMGIVQHRELYEPPIPVIRAGAAAIGFVEVEHGQDPVVRAGSLRRRHAGRLHHSLAARLFDLAAPALKVDPRPADTHQRLWINFRGPAGTFPTYPYYQVYRGEIPPETFAGKVVLVGVAALSLQDRHPTPFSGASWLPGAPGGGGLFMPGTEIQAHLLDTLLADDPLRRFPGGVTLVLVLLAGTGAAWLAGRLRPLAGIGALLALGLGCLGAAQAVFAAADLWVDVVPPALAGGLAGVGTIALDSMREERVRRE
jgi:adenylate cyclase